MKNVYQDFQLLFQIWHFYSILFVHIIFFIVHHVLCFICDHIFSLKMRPMHLYISRCLDCFSYVSMALCTMLCVPHPQDHQIATMQQKRQQTFSELEAHETQLKDAFEKHYSASEDADEQVSSKNVEWESSKIFFIHWMRLLGLHSQWDQNAPGLLQFDWVKTLNFIPV